MPKRSRKSLDVNEEAFAVVQRVIGMTESADPEAAMMERAKAQGKDPIAAALGRRGGLKGGAARRDNMTQEQRVASARKAARARWGTP